MSGQLSLSFPRLGAPRGWPAASRTTDPDTSKASEVRVTTSGKRQTQAQRVHSYIVDHPYCTAGEIAAGVGLDRHTVSKRTADLARLDEIVVGPARECRVHRTRMRTWRAVR